MKLVLKEICLTGNIISINLETGLHHTPYQLASRSYESSFHMIRNTLQWLYVSWSMVFYYKSLTGFSAVQKEIFNDTETVIFLNSLYLPMKFDGFSAMHSMEEYLTILPHQEKVKWGQKLDGIPLGERIHPLRKLRKLKNFSFRKSSIRSCIS